MVRIRLAKLMALVLVVAACTGGGASPTPAATTAATEAPATAAPTEATAAKCTGQKMSLLLSFFPNIQHIGFLIASNRGFYEDEGLDVEVQPGGPDVNVEAAVGDGSTDMGLVGSYGAVLRARAGGVPLKVIAQTYQRMQLFFVSLKSSGIAKVTDWAGKRIGQIAVGANPERDAMLLAAGLKTTDVTLVQQSFGIDDFKAGKVDVMDGVVYFHPAAVQLDGTYKWPDDLNIFYPDDNGAALADQVIVANEDFLAANADAIPCFLRASMKGWQVAIDAANNVDSLLPDLYAFANKDAFPEAHQKLAFKDVLAIVAPDGTSEGLFQIDPKKFQDSYDTLRQVGYLESEVDVAKSFDDSFMKAVSTP